MTKKYQAPHFERTPSPVLESFRDVRWTRRRMLRAAIGVPVMGWCLARGADAVLGAVDPGAAKSYDAFRVHSDLPLNAEPMLAQLSREWITPVELFYVRNHGPIPSIDARHYVLSIEGLVERPMRISLQELAERFSHHQVTATMACAGNRRAEMAKEKPISGVPWEAGAIGNATWSGWRLADVLKAAGVRGDARHVWMDGSDHHTVKGENIVFGGSIPLDRALSDAPGAAVLLATRMNGDPLLPEHGAPLRAVVPGYIGARSVKWLRRIVVSDRPSDNHYIQHAYRLIGEDTPQAWSQAAILYELPIQSAFVEVSRDRASDSHAVAVRGYAHAEGAPGRTIKSVEISADQGNTWHLARLAPQVKPYCWRLWEARIDHVPDGGTLMVRSTDDRGHQQPRHVDWNVKGYMQNGWQSIVVDSP